MTHPHPQRWDLLIAPGHRRLRHRLGPHLGADTPSTVPRQSHRRNAAAAACAALSPRDQTAVLQDCWRGDDSTLRGATVSLVKDPQFKEPCFEHVGKNSEKFLIVYQTPQQ